MACNRPWCHGYATAPQAASRAYLLRSGDRALKPRHESIAEPVPMRKALIIVLTLVTAAVHLSFFLSDPSSGLIYGLNALGYVDF